MIREFREGDLDEVMSIWLSGNRKALGGLLKENLIEITSDKIILND